MALVFRVNFMLQYIMLWMNVCFCCVRFRFSVLTEQIGWEERLQNTYFVSGGWDVKPYLSQPRFT